MKVQAVVQEPPKKDVRKPRSENVGLDQTGAFFVDHTCIDCDTCRYMAPDFFKRKNSQSAVLAQPETKEQRLQAFQALLSCPTYSIHVADKDREAQQEAEESFPRNVYGLDNVFHCGFHSELSFGCASYLVTRPEGNVLVDVPRFVPKLLKRIQAMGGAKYIFLTHRDDVAEHAKWAKALGAERIMHVGETNAQQGTDQVEVKLEGEGPWPLPDGSGDMQIVLTPGHTEHHCCLVYEAQKVLFSGDHLATDSVGEWTTATSPDKGKLGITRRFNWWQVGKQVESCEKLAAFDWVHVLPGHGRPGSVDDAADRKHQIQLLVERETARGLGHLEFDHSGIMPE
ncbi:Metallo-hydrolase/oxidoreductase [Coccomyxa subellipsoidea C-169]|uniref:Metallo-hydrolase/oxidoreductase n=1 Tax=Coccomyxa subellipsoidea (strain C-169) TaxID=574566 RepID=I0Z946_COCSC|nr:Metallo-hydrolase/oxidoreductase [Coccomyxa subellipsoidea C-169]EIE27165.1 Metallo-hydrolase/oxidoreductase [Coccomyxa subellipsoidea C-169]|eukprot:XP_005651709.1 Metallo-hydrolase/oxidoreductase [Coccomyxa subellipsoidea C-169]